MTSSITSAPAFAALPTSASLPAPAPTTSASRNGFVDDSSSTMRNVVMGAGLVGGIGGAAAGALALGGKLAGVSRGGAMALIAGGIGAAILGTVIAQTVLGPKHTQWSETVTGTHMDALKRASELPGDVGVVRLEGDNAWGLLPLGERNVDGKGAGSVSFPSNAPIDFAAIVSDDGDAHVRVAGGGFQNAGSPTAIDAGAVDPHDAADVNALVGGRLGVDSKGNDVVLGQALFKGQAFATDGEALRSLATAGVRDAVLMHLGSGAAAATVVFARGGTAAAGVDVLARGTSVTPVSSATIVAPGGLEKLVDAWQASAPGNAYTGTSVSPTTIDASTLAAGDPATAATLIGQRLGVTGPTGNQRVLTIGQPLLEGAASSSEREAAARLWEAGRPDAVLVRVAGGVLAFAADSALLPGGDARPVHPMVSPTSAITVIRGGGSPMGLSSLTIDDAAHAFVAGTPQLAPVTTSTLAAADAASLAGLRIGVDSEGAPVRLGQLLGTHATVDEARLAAAATGARELVVPLADGAARFAVPDGVAKYATRLAPLGDQGLIRGQKLFTINTDGSFTFQQRTTPFDVQEPIGKTVRLGEGNGTVTAHLGSYSDRAAALNAIKGTLTDRSHRVVIKSDGPAGKYHAYELSAPASGAANWDAELGSTAASAWYDGDIRTSTRDVRNEPTRWGTDVVTYRNDFTHEARLLDDGRVQEVAAGATRQTGRVEIGRDRAFDPNEPVGRSARAGNTSGRIGEYVRSFTSLASAQATARDRILTFGRASVVINRQNNVGTFHLYEFSPGNGGNGSWDTGRAAIDLATWTRTVRASREIREDRQGQYGIDRYVFRVTEQHNEHEEWRRSGGTSRLGSTRPVEVDRVQVSVRRAPAPTPPGGGTSPGDDNGRPGNGGTSPGDDNGRPGNGGTSPGDDRTPARPTPAPAPAPRPTPVPDPEPDPRPVPGNSSDNGNPGDDDF